MSNSIRKFIAVFLAIWLPLFSGAVLAASVSMQMQSGSCHVAGMAAMQDMDEYQHAVSYDQSAAQDQHEPSCTICGVCHLACSGYLGVQAIKTPEILQSPLLVTPYLFSFHSITSTPLVPPPLA